jgi:uncharacterized protein YqjF (DUF2071 family)
MVVYRNRIAPKRLLVICLSKLPQQQQQQSNMKFMVHDRWSDVLFLHWKVPSHLESCLIDNIPSSFIVDRYPTAVDSDDVNPSSQQHSCLWIGLILLTEEQVGPAIGRTKWTCVTHHGINVRTYIKGDKKQQQSPPTSIEEKSTRDPWLRRRQRQQQQQPLPTPSGIYFFSLECNDEFTSWGANWFGMPYRVANIVRNFQTFTRPDDDDNTTSAGSKTPAANKAVQFFMSSIRNQANDGKPSLLRVMCRTIQNVIMATWTSSIYRTIQKYLRHLLPLPSTTSQQLNSNKKQHQSTILSSSSRSSAALPFQVECQWTVTDYNNDHQQNDPSNNNEEEVEHRKFARWLMERYHVYTHKYGLDWIGSISHEPWPLLSQQQVRLDKLYITGVGSSYQPNAVRPILELMSNHQPDSVLFSPGVGPIQFQMLRPIS